MLQVPHSDHHDVECSADDNYSRETEVHSQQTGAVGGVVRAEDEVAVGGVSGGKGAG